MEINIGQKKENNGITSKHRKLEPGGTYIVNNPKKVSVVIDKDGNHIDIETKRIIKKKEE